MHSSNVAATKLALSLGRDKLFEYYTNLGFGSVTGIELASEGFIGPEKIVVCDPDTEIPQQAADAGLFGNIAEGLSALVSDQIEDAEVKEIAEVALEDADSVDSEVEETTDSEKEDAE